MKYVIAILAATLTTAWGQTLTAPAGLDKLAAKAKEHVEVTLDHDLLQMAGGFLSAKDSDQAKAKQLISGLKGIIVRTFEFSAPGQYTDADLDGVRSQLSSGWSKIVNAKDKNDSVEVYLRRGGQQISGLAVIAAEPKELTVVMIDGAIRPEDLAGLEGNFGIPKLRLGDVLGGTKAAPAGKRDSGRKQGKEEEEE